jgi:hypothetical protein
MIRDFLERNQAVSIDAQAFDILDNLLAHMLADCMRQSSEYIQG